MKVEILRLTTDETRPQRGVLRIDGEPLLTTLELPWRDNESKLSCIPLGAYKCIRDTNRRTSGGMVIPVTYEVTQVPNRSGILFHVGNTSADSHGCILIGMKYGYLKGHAAILESKSGFDFFIKVLQSVSSFEVEIKCL